MTVDSITIGERHGIVEGESIKLTASLMPETAFESSVEWSSSNPDVIECSEKGVITGKTPGKYADIYCKSVWGDVSDKIRVYCVEKVGYSVRSDLKGYVNFIYSAPDPLAFLALHINLNSILKMFFEVFSLLSFGLNSTSTVNAATGDPIAMGKCEIKGKYGSYAYISFKSGEVERDGFIKFSRFEETAGLYPTLSAKDMNVWGDGKAYDGKILTTEYKGEITWKVADEKIAKRDKVTGQITGMKPGVTTITATTPDGTSETCTIHSLYPWPQTWTTQTNRDTYLYRAEGSEYKADKALSKNKSFIVYGDEGGSGGWAYGKINGTKTWGYIPISHISTKGTVSQYNFMNFRWPIEDLNIKKISSPFGPRSSKNGGNHKGFDIISNTSGEINGKSVVATFEGTIRKIYIDNNKETTHGNTIVITTNKLDPISGKNLTAIYMHLSKWDTNSSGNIVVNGKVLKEGDSVTMGQIIGCAGNTGYNTTGPHLHYEVNNQNAALRSASNNPFSETINPIYFYMSMDNSITKSNTCEAASNGNGFYWYGENE